MENTRTKARKTLHAKFKTSDTQTDGRQAPQTIY
jgi:hypothetical protein